MENEWLNTIRKSDNYISELRKIDENTIINLKLTLDIISEKMIKLYSHDNKTII
jgi:hypothetical protein